MTPYSFSNFVKASISSFAGMVPLMGRLNLSVASKTNFGKWDCSSGFSAVSCRVKTAKPRLFNSLRAVVSSGASTVPLRDFPSAVATVYLNVAITRMFYLAGFFRCGDESGKERVRFSGAAFEFWVKLAADHEGVVFDFDDFDEVLFGVDAGDQ